MIADMFLFFIMLNNLHQMQLKTFPKRVIQKTAESTGDLIGTKIDNKFTGVSKNLQQNNSEIVTNDNYKGIPKERYVFQEKTHSLLMNEDLNSITMKYQKIHSKIAQRQLQMTIKKINISIKKTGNY